MKAEQKKLPLILAVLVVAVLVFAVNTLTSLALTQWYMELALNSSGLYLVITLARGILALFLGSIIVFKAIEKRGISLGALLLVTLVVEVLCWYPNTMITVFVARYGSAAMAKYGQISAYVSALVAALLVTAAVRILTAPKKLVPAGDASMRVGLFGHVLLLLLTGSIWYLVWNYRTTRYLNCVPAEEYRNPATKLLLCMFVPFYGIYWTYKSAQRIDKLAKTVGVNSDLAVACLILEFFVPIIPPILMQDKINKINTLLSTKKKFVDGGFVAVIDAMKKVSGGKTNIADFSDAELDAMIQECEK